MRTCIYLYFISLQTYCNCFHELGFHIQAVEISVLLLDSVLGGVHILYRTTCISVPWMANTFILKINQILPGVFTERDTCVFNHVDQRLNFLAPVQICCWFKVLLRFYDIRLWCLYTAGFGILETAHYVLAPGIPVSKAPGLAQHIQMVMGLN